MLDSKTIYELAQKHKNICEMIENLDKNTITLTIDGTYGTNNLSLGTANETEQKVIGTIANSLKELAVTYERKIQDLVRKELR